MRAIRRLLRDSRGATLVEFGILAPAMFAMLIGVLQIGIGMQAYNSLRGIASDTARYAATSYQKSQDKVAAEIEVEGNDIAIAAPYALTASDLDLQVVEVTTPRVAGTFEFTITINYQVPSLLGFIGVENIPISYSRPIFVVDRDD